MQTVFKYWEEDQKGSLTYFEQKIVKLAMDVNESKKAREEKPVVATHATVAVMGAESMPTKLKSKISQEGAQVLE